MDGPSHFVHDLDNTLHNFRGCNFVCLVTCKPHQNFGHLRPMKHAYARFSVIAFAAVVLLFFTQCNKERFASSSDQTVTFSADTVLFDTVFTTIGSTTIGCNTNTIDTQVSNVV